MPITRFIDETQPESSLTQLHAMPNRAPLCVNSIDQLVAGESSQE